MATSQVNLPSGYALEEQQTPAGNLPPGYTVEQAPAPVKSATPAPPQFPIKPLPGESFADTMKRGVAAGKAETPEQIKEANEGALTTGKHLAENAAGITASEVGSPLAGAGAYAATKGLLEPEQVVAHPISTAGETAGYAVAPYVFGKAGELAGKVAGKIAGPVGDAWKYLTTPLNLMGEAGPETASIPVSEQPLSMPKPPVETAPPVRPPKPVSTARQVSDLVDHAFGIQPLQPDVPLRAQGAAMGGSPAFNEEFEQPAAGPRIQTPSRNTTLMDNLKNRMPNSNPPERGVPMGEQPPSAERTPAQPKEETVHPMDRQFIHVNGAQAFEKTAGRPQLQEDLLALENDQIREVLRKSGEDMGTKRVGSAGKTADPNDYTRPEAFDILFEKGYTPEQIVKEAPPRSKPARVRVPFGPPR